ncbi:MAG: polysaccharide export protein [Coprobacter sp.]|nr:polysaccharide export protein [Coprobacter sp.]
MRTHIILLFALSLITFSCKTKSDIVYFQQVGTENSQQDIPLEVFNYEHYIIPDDILTITVTATDPDAVAIFNLPAASFLTSTQVSVTPNLQTFLVSVDGDIDFPVLGKIHVAGLTRGQLSDLLRERISEYVDNPLVSVRVLNFKIVVLGEVNSPGSFTVNGEKVSILDAIGLARDLNIYGRRDNVLLIRENGGKKEFHRLDLTQPDLFASPYYYLQKDDVIYVEPNKVRQSNASFSSNKQFNISIVSTVISAVSVLTSLCLAFILRK